jgi:outer membrane protein assembly factor BamB
MVSVAAQGTSDDGSLQECWKLVTDQTGNTKIASDNDYHIFYTSKGNLQSIQLSDGNIQWKTELGGEVVSNILYDDGKIFVMTKLELARISGSLAGSLDGYNEFTIRAISSQTGLTVWQHKIKLNHRDTDLGPVDLVVTEKFLNVVFNVGEIYLLVKSSGEIDKNIKLESGFTSRPAVFADRIFIGDKSENRLQYISDGINQKIEGLDFKNTAKVIYLSTRENKTNLFIADEFGTVACYNLESKKMLWKMRTGAEIIGMTEENGYLLVSSNDNFVYSLSQSNGNINWKKRLSGRSEFALSPDKSLLYLASLNSDLLTVTKSDKGKTISQIILLDEEYFVSRPLLVKDFVVVPTNFGFAVYNSLPCGLKN